MLVVGAPVASEVIELLSPTSPCQIGGFFTLTYDPQVGGVIPQPLPAGSEVRLKVVIQFCALA